MNQKSFCSWGTCVVVGVGVDAYGRQKEGRWRPKSRIGEYTPRSSGLFPQTRQRNGLHSSHRQECVELPGLPSIGLILRPQGWDCSRISENPAPQKAIQFSLSISAPSHKMKQQLRVGQYCAKGPHSHTFHRSPPPTLHSCRHHTGWLEWPSTEVLDYPCMEGKLSLGEVLK